MSDGMLDYKLQLVEAAGRHYDPAARRRRAARRALRAGAPLVAAAAVVALVIALVRPAPEVERTPPAPAAATEGELAPVDFLEPAFPSGREALPFERLRLSLVVFGASWCAPCMEDLPTLTAAREMLDEVGGVLRYVATRDNPAAVRRAPFPAAIRPDVLLDPKGRAARKWKVRGVPVAFLVAPDGRIVGRREGPLDLDWIRRQALHLRVESAATILNNREPYAALRDRSNIVPMPKRMRTLPIEPEAETHLVYDGPGHRMWIALGVGGQCSYFLTLGGEGGGSCGRYGKSFRDRAEFGWNAGGLVHGVFPDGTRDFRAHFEGGRTVRVQLQGNALVEQFAARPRRLTYLGPAGRRHSEGLGRG